ncbi:MAG: hypothetical protein HPY45_10340 [Anaerolineae bacterium]|nr:hypothetical protein [Anaerolineae bacterium]
MDDKKIGFNLEFALYVLSFIIALGFRLAWLGRLPLSDSEATWALQALGLARGEQVSVASHTLYVLLTQFLFSLFGDSNFVARVVPALLGGSIVFAPYLFHRHLGRWAAVILSFGLAIDPAMIAASRQPGSPMLAIVMFVFMAGFLINGYEAWAGVFGALALMGGAGVWQAVVAVLLSLLWGKVLRRDREADINAVDWAEISWKKFLYWFAGSFVFASSFLLIQPRGLGASLSSVVDYVSVWVKGGGVSLEIMLSALLMYEIFPLILGLSAIVLLLFRKDALGGYLARLWVVLLVLLLAYSNKATVDLCLVVIPLWALAARLVVRIVEGLSGEFWLFAFGYGAVVFALLVFVWLNLVSLLNPQPASASLLQRYIVIAVSAVLIVVIALLVTIGWSQKHASYGLMVGAGIIFIIYTFSATWNSAGLGKNPDLELWWSSPDLVESGLMMKSIQQISEWQHKGFRDQVDVWVIGVDLPSLKWFLRDLHNVVFSRVYPVGVSPSIVITTSEQVLSLADRYAGQDFVWWRGLPLWTGLDVSGRFRWIAFREASQDYRALILWVRSDLFPGTGVLAGQPTP